MVNYIEKQGRHYHKGQRGEKGYNQEGGHIGDFWGIGNILFLELNSGYMDIYNIYNNSLSYTIMYCHFSMCVISLIKKVLNVSYKSE